MQFKFSKFATALLASGIISLPITASANDSSELEELRGLVQELSQQVKVLARKGEINEEAAAADKKASPVVKASSSGFSFGSADGKNEIKFRGLLQADHRSYSEGANDVRARSRVRAGLLNAEGFNAAEDTSLLRRVRPTIEGKVAGKYGFRFTPEFAGGSASVVDAYVEANLNPAFNIRAGKFKSSVGLERLQSGSDIKFIERSYVTNAILPNRDLGISVYGDVLNKKLNYNVGIVNGVADGGNISTGTEYNGEREYTARLFTTPFVDSDSALAGLGFGIGATYTDFTGEQKLNWTDTTAADGSRGGLPDYLTNGQQTFFRYGANTIADGKRFRISPQASYYNGPFGLITEYARVNQDVSLIARNDGSGGNVDNVPLGFLAGTNKTLSHDAWQIAGSYLITGEDASFKGVKPKNDFDLDKGGWGAWELVARYSEINLDSDTFKNRNGAFANENRSGANAINSAYADGSISAKSAQSWTAGVNWYLNSNAKIALNYEQTTFDGGAIAKGVAQNAVPTAANIRDRNDERALLARFQVAF
ncbi:MAG: porin [Methylotenera sp.]|nr:porin [Methylotenera sp.]MDD4925709.1 porin [Methylotenera sp.]